jgi:hypothetical protein
MAKIGFAEQLAAQIAGADRDEDASGAGMIERSQKRTLCSRR